MREKGSKKRDRERKRDKRNQNPVEREREETIMEMEGAYKPFTTLS